MGSAVELATAYVTIAASGNDLVPSFGRSFRAVEKVAGDSGKRMGQALTGQLSKATEADVAKAKAAYEQASKKVTATAETQAAKVEAARRKEEIAQARVTEALAKYAPESSQVLAAQDRLAMSAQKVSAAQLEQQSAMSRANRELEETQRELRETERAAESAAGPFQRLGDRVKSALRGDFRGAFRTVEREGQEAAEEIEQDFRRSGKDAARGFSAGFKGGFAGVATGIGGYLGLDQLWEGSKLAIGEAANLEQSVGAVNTVFKDGSGQMLAWAEQADSVLGMTANQYNEQATLLGTQLRNAGIEDYTTKTNDLITLGADFSAMFGGTSTEAVEALSSALKGERDPIEKYGISLRQSAIDARAAELGFSKVGGSFDQQAQAAATMSLIYEQSADAQGAFARESDTSANVAQRLKARVIELAGALGARLLPWLTDLGSWVLDKGIPALEDFGRGVQGVWTLLTTGDFTGAANLFGFEEDSGFVDFLYGARDAFTQLWEKALKPLGAWVADHWKDIAAFFAGFGGTLLIAGLISLGGAIVALIGSISWIPLAIGAAVGALTWFFTQTEVGKTIFAAVVDWIVNTAWPAIQTFAGWVATAAVWLWQNVLVPAWHGIRTAIAATVDWLVGTAWPVIKAVWDGIATAAVWLWQNVLVPAWTGIRTAISATVEWITGTMWPALQATWTAIAGAATWLWQSIIQPVWNGIKTAIAIAVTAVLVYIDLLKWYFEHVIAPVAMWLWNNVLAPAWAGIQMAIGAVVTWFQTTAWPALKAAWDAVAAAATWLWQNVLKPVWAGIQAAISAVVTWFQTVAWPIIQTVIGYIRTGFDLLKLGLATIWGFIRDNVIAPVVSWLMGTAWPIIQTVIGYIRTGFGVMRDGLRTIWSEIRTRIIEPVANWFRDTIQPLFDRVTGGVGDAFETLRDTVTTVWNGIRDKAKEPIRFLVEDIVRDGIVKKYNSVAKTFGVSTIDESLFSVGFDGGGWTGPGAKLQPAGVVHADEFVIRKESQRSLRSKAPGFLDALNNYGAKALAGLGFGYDSGGWVKPFQGSFRSNSPYGMRNGRLHAGMDFPTPTGTPLIAVSPGVVQRVTSSGPAGNRVAMATDMAGIVAGYHHMSRILVRVGQAVTRGQLLGYSGNSGRSTGPHLHFSIKRNGSYVNPSPYLSGAGVAGSADGGLGFLNPFDGLWESLKSKVREGVGSSPFGDMLFNVPKKIIDAGKSFLVDKFGALGDFGSNLADSAGGAARWSPVATQALMMKGQFSVGNLASLMRRMNQESSYNPRAINNWDSNARRGTPSKGLMQVIGPTFRSYAEPGYDKDIYDPLSNILASINYTLDRYGSLRAGWDRAGGYAAGGLVTGGIYDTGGVLEHGSFAMNLSGRPEVVLNPAESRAYMAGQASAGRPSGPMVQTGDIYGHNAEDVAREIQKEQRKREALYAR